MAKKDSVSVVTVAPEARLDSIKFINQVYSEIQKNKIDFKTFSAKIKVDFEGGDGKKSDFNAFVRMAKDSAIWVSVNAVLGIEAFRILITPDSVKVLNKLDKIVQLRSVNYLKEVTGIPFSFYEVQDLIIGNPIYLDSAIAAYKKEADAISLIHIGNLFKHLITVSSADYRIQFSKLDDVNSSRARTAHITYGNYQGKDDSKFSTFRKVTVSEKTKLDIEMDYKQFEFNEPLNYPFNIPKNYKSN